MKNRLETQYAGLTLKNPIIIGSSGLTDRIEKIVELEKAGAGAVVLKSLFEEQILQEATSLLGYDDSPEALDYLRHYIEANSIQKYIGLIREAKAACTIPVIASINCYQPDSWAQFALDIQKAGADALQINILKVATSPDEKPEAYEQLHIRILEEVKKEVHIPVIIKLGQRFSNIVGMVNQLKANKAAGVVLFNRFYQPDIDIDTLQFIPGPVFSTGNDFSNTLRWTGIVSGQVQNIDLAASTGIHNGESVIKSLLAGASAVEICSAVYQQGNGIIQTMKETLNHWMEQKGYHSINDFKGILNFRNETDHTIYERVQFMKYFSSKE